MKKYKYAVLIVLYLIIPGTLAFCFDSFIGLRTGFLLPSFSGTDYENEIFESQQIKKLKPGFTGGLFYELKINENWSLQPELLFTMAGSAKGDTFYTRTTNIYLIELPVIANFCTDLKIGFIKLFGGLSGNLAIGQVLEISLPDNSIEDFSSAINYLAAGLLVGGSYSFPISTGFIFAEVRYAINFTPLYKDCGTKNTRQHYLAISIGYTYRLLF